MKKLLLLFSGIATLSGLRSQDAEGCKDHQLFNRMKNYYIEQCASNFDALSVPVSVRETKSLEGTVTRLQYVYNTESGEKMPSQLQIVKNYENAILAKGGKKVFYSQEASGDQAINAVFNANINGKEVWIALGGFYEPQGGGEIGNYVLYVVEMESMKQEISATEMMNALNTSGSVSLYINFDTGKSTIKAESQPIIEQIYQMMKSNSSLRISIEGHTDNTGNAASNKTLSESRAKAVMDALAAKGIAKDRMSAKGFGQENPVADNSSEEGKAKNRRVELKKI